MKKCGWVYACHGILGADSQGIRSSGDFRNEVVCSVRALPTIACAAKNALGRRYNTQLASHKRLGISNLGDEEFGYWNVKSCLVDTWESGVNVLRWAREE